MTNVQWEVLIVSCFFPIQVQHNKSIFNSSAVSYKKTLYGARDNLCLVKGQTFATR